MRLICTYEPLCAREGPFASVRSSIMLLWQRAAEARAGTDRDESTVIDRDIAIYQTVNADADSDGPGSDRDRAHYPPLKTDNLNQHEATWFMVFKEHRMRHVDVLRHQSGTTDALSTLVTLGLPPPCTRADLQ